MQKTIVSHSGGHHADDVCGVTVLQRLFPESKLIRTRDPAVVAAADFAVDVGGVWDPSKGRFDHHQKGFSGCRDDGTVYASAGLVWAAHGVDYVLSHLAQVNPQELPGSPMLVRMARVIAERIDAELIIHVDREDTGAAHAAEGAFGLSALLAHLNLTYQELAGFTNAEQDEMRLAAFQQACDITEVFLRRLVYSHSAVLVAEGIVRHSPRLFDGKVLLVESPGLPWEDVVIREMPDVLFVVYPDSSDNQYQIRTVPVALGSFKARKDLPAAWAGLRNEHLARVTGVPDAVFAHNALFIGGAVSKEGALKLAELAL